MSRRVRAAGAGLVLGLVLAGQAICAEPEDPTCRTGLFPAENPQLGLGRIKGPGSLALRDDLGGCAKSDARCLRPGALPAGASVITGRSHGGLVCVLSVDGREQAAGWTPLDRIAARKAPRDPPLSAWRGWWRDGPSVILLDPQPDGRLLISGRSSWQGLTDPHIGQINAVSRPHGARLVAEDSEDDVGCKATLDLLGPYLVVQDNTQCGGMNVTFTGVYRRFTPKATRKPPR